MMSVIVAKKDILTTIATGQHMVKCPSELYSPLPCHGIIE
jgi:hypothetical protein